MKNLTEVVEAVRVFDDDNDNAKAKINISYFELTEEYYKFYIGRSRQI